jgi:hypothetical protein
LAADHPDGCGGEGEGLLDDVFGLNLSNVPEPTESCRFENYGFAGS